MEINYFEQNPKKTIAIVSIIFLFAMALSLEYLLRFIGYMPECSYYHKVDKLIVYNKFYTDYLGIFKANPNYKWEEAEAININKEGFRSPDFEKSLNNHKVSERQKSILLLGDSFAWGASAKPITSSFADLLRNANYEVYNTGIPGVGPTQYEAVAKVYIPLLKPDYVIVALYLGNDLLEKPHPMVPNHNLFHVTNAGWILGFDEIGTPLSAEEAYKYYIATNILIRFMKKTSLGTLCLWYQRDFIPKIRDIMSLNSKNNNIYSAVKYKYTFDCLSNIKELADKYNCRYYLLIIPNIGKNCKKRTGDEFKHTLETLNPIYLKNIKEQMFNPFPDCHLNKEGHSFVKDVILDVLRKNRFSDPILK